MLSQKLVQNRNVHRWIFRLVCFRSTKIYARHFRSIMAGYWVTIRLDRTLFGGNVRIYFIIFCSRGDAPKKVKSFIQYKVNFWQFWSKILVYSGWFCFPLLFNSTIQVCRARGPKDSVRPGTARLPDRPMLSSLERSYFI